METRRSDWLVTLAALAIVAGTVAAGHLAVKAPPPGPPSTPASFDLEPTCAEWNDGCIVCRRTDDGPVCSMPGIACVRREPQCLKRDGT